ncbi:hypothetical protein E0765_05835 [Sulfuricurvum sp. IAE1]|jgi:hypothetical protein|uniref:hypothetical protein n=1 Tax=Sulfuricurvum sp. IAE1 TaxID=2546102 RepID=UPI00104B94C4|nr:hypothetical protein [Sulfuricurvum sp. IAE1]MDD3769668.1 hypothetical protein [Sulfuricurvum sp.]MDD3769710.1 hypothetical protein [Sulfuricurvum sp.]MDX9966912.1 hypothetical protein [Sulfuricurvum sp.]TDA64231.1 hypothetical protein E0765_05835 [Sulfuricurvum sp. IAE1]
MKELTITDLKLAFEQDLKMSLYVHERYGIEASFALIACDEYDIDKAHLTENIRHSDVSKRLNEHYVAVLFTFVDPTGARCALEKLINRYPQFDLKGSLVTLNKGDTIESVCERAIEANRYIHQNPQAQIIDEFQRRG